MPRYSEQHLPPPTPPCQTPPSVMQYRFGRIDGAGDLAQHLIDMLASGETIRAIRQECERHVALHQQVTRTGALPL